MRKLVAVTAVVALLAGVTTGVALTRSPEQPWKQAEPVAEVTSPPNVFWTGQAQSEPVALVAQEVRVTNSSRPATLVDLVADGVVAGREVVTEEARRPGSTASAPPVTSTWC